MKKLLERIESLQEGRYTVDDIAMDIHQRLQNSKGTVNWATEFQALRDQYNDGALVMQAARQLAQDGLVVRTVPTGPHGTMSLTKKGEDHKWPVKGS